MTANKPLDERVRKALREFTTGATVQSIYTEAVRDLLSAEAYERERADRLQREMETATAILEQAMNAIGQ